MARKITKAVFPVAGLGTRFLPATKASPKEMLSLVDKPLIQYVVEEAIAAGIDEIIMVTGRNKSAIEDHFDRSVELEHTLEAKGDAERLRLVQQIAGMVDFCYIRQNEPKGLGHAILRAKKLVGNEPFAVLLGDDIIHSPRKPAIGQLMEVFRKTGAPVVAVEQAPMENISAYGVVAPASRRGKLTHVRSMVEKPQREKAPSNLAIIGRYVLTPDIFARLEATEPDYKGEIQLTAALNALARRRKVLALEFEGIRYDAGDKLGYLRATVEFALRHPDLGRSFRDFLKGLPL
ncbi:MAG: UTP--glucose-1-phosphate uridylyltransferase GalU [Nitrospinae bacterium]|nr:UTP--glucose-1-phosphate uridylyltransferase GalU [Nitrospinota bacterium]